MLFNSYVFILVYLPIVFIGFFLIGNRSRPMAAFWLTAASVFFYGYWNPRFVALLLGSVIFNFGAGYLMGHSRSESARKVLLVIAVATNLSLLGVFKYANFFINTVDSFGAHLPAVQIILPLGISFFTFTQIAFVVDVYRRVVSEFNFMHYLLFVTWFPHLIAGPVLHHKQMMPQFKLPETYRPNAESMTTGVTLFCLGLSKKVLLADSLAQTANPLFGSAAIGHAPALVAAWAGSLAYTLQLYFDFSGYSDMAIGLSRIFNVRLPLNFDSPYKAASIIDFWRRWHMTLSQFLRDYLYIPLGGNRKGPVRRQVNLLATMLLGGLWHGAAWTFVFWGGLHGVYLLINHAWRRIRMGLDPKAGGSTVPAVMLTFIAVVVAWVPFRATSMNAVITIWRGMFGFNGLSLPGSFSQELGTRFGNHVQFLGWGLPSNESFFWIFLGLAIAWVLPNTQQWLGGIDPASKAATADQRFGWRPSVRYAIPLGLLFAVCMLSLKRSSDFLYFQF
jgi:alginate O-acetyltransferase complex protein AlgI